MSFLLDQLVWFSQYFDLIERENRKTLAQPVAPGGPTESTHRQTQSTGAALKISRHRPGAVRQVECPPPFTPSVLLISLHASVYEFSHDLLTSVEICGAHVNHDTVTLFDLSV